MKSAKPRPRTDLKLRLVTTGLSQRQLSDDSGISESDISRIFRGWLTHPEKLAKIDKTLTKKGAPAV